MLREEEEEREEVEVLSEAELLALANNGEVVNKEELMVESKEIVEEKDDEEKYVEGLSGILKKIKFEEAKHIYFILAGVLLVLIIGIIVVSVKSKNKEDFTLFRARRKIMNSNL